MRMVDAIISVSFSPTNIVEVKEDKKNRSIEASYLIF